MRSSRLSGSTTPHTTNGPFTFIDLFSGCGGFSLGLERAGFRALAAIDVNSHAVETYRKNFPNVAHVLNQDLTTFDPTELDILIKGERVDLIVGGPPCQGFSNVRKVDGANHGKRLIEDSRRFLYQDFLRFVAYFRPSIFVIENVLGIRTAASGEFYTRVNSEARALGYRVHGEEIRAWRYGVPQKRIRQLIVGTKNELPIFAMNCLLPPTHSEFADLDGQINKAVHKHLSEIGGNLLPPVTLWEAIGDLSPLAAGSGVQSCQYDRSRRQVHLARYTGRYIENVLEVHKAKQLTGHVARPHSDRDLRDFARLHEGESSAVAMRERNVTFEWPYSKEHFRDRYTRQHRNRLCSTIVAHLSKDGLMFIHPTQCRSLTPREAARIQTFPDWFVFPEARTHAFRLIGNAVPPVIGETVGLGIKHYFEMSREPKQSDIWLPATPLEAFERLIPLIQTTDDRCLRRMTIEEFKSSWFSVGFLYSNLHPDGVLENGEILYEPSTMNALPDFVKELSSPTYARSGWPVKLVPIGKEARRRFLKGELSQDDYYYSHAQMAGIQFLKKGLNANGSAAFRS